MSESALYADDLPCLPTAKPAPRRTAPLVWLLIGYMWLFIHRPFEIWPWLGAIHVERGYMAVIIVYWLLDRPALPRGNRLHRCFAAFVLAMLVSWFVSPYQSAGDETVENYLKYGVFYVLLVTSVRRERDLYKMIAGYIAVMTLLMAHSLREYLCGRAAYAQGITRLWPVGHAYDCNDLAGLIVCSLPLVWVLWHAWSGWRWRALLCGYVGLAGYCVLLTGSRMGFIGMVLAGLLAAWASPRRWRTMPVFLVLLAALWMVLPEDRQDRIMTLFDPSRGPKSATGSAGNFRYAGLEQALPLFAQRPGLGFGPLSFGVVSGKGLMPHNLYGQLLAELGIAGAVAFGLIVWGVARNTSEARRLMRSWGPFADPLPGHVALAAAAAYVLLLIMAWGFNFLFWYVWLWFGGFQVVALHCLQEQAAQAAACETIAMEPQDESWGKQE